MAREFQQVGVVGLGTMGAGIAEVFARSGLSVVAVEMDEAAVVRGRGHLEHSTGRAVSRGKLSADEQQTLLGRVSYATSLEALADADLVVEAVPEQLELKRHVFTQLDKICKPAAVLATNTSSLSVTEIAVATGRPGKVVGLHFFNPAPVMPLVEVVAAESTGRAAIQAGLDFVAGLGKTAIVSADAPGFIVNRVNRGFTLEPLRMLEAGEADVLAIDSAIEAAGYRMGPFRLMDLVGVDIGYAVAQALYQGFDEAGRFRPSPIQARMVEAGTLGRKTGRGFYAYGTGTEARLSPADAAEMPDVAEMPDGAGMPDVADARTQRAAQLSAAQIVERVNLAIVNEAYRAVEERVAAPQDVDLAMKLGANHPEGPFERAGHLGLRAVVEGLRRQHQAATLSADQYEIAPLLWQLATA